MNTKVIHVNKLKNGQKCLIIKWNGRKDWVGFDMVRHGLNFISITPKYGEENWGFNNNWFFARKSKEERSRKKYLVFPYKDDNKVKQLKASLREYGENHTYLN